ncbi:hypothetical protein ABZY02_07730 [Streptomyces sp. NPDC006649]|uniref:hypothetical protein n=1 Tax=Streptomyces sp. NPDC006649 TaxID=3156896 RepID=UPI0033B8A211
MAPAFDEENSAARRDPGHRLSARLAKAALRAVGPTLEARSVGNALLIHPRGFVDNRALAFSERLAADPQHTLVVLDLPARPDNDVWETVARTLDRKGNSFRLIPGRGTREDVQRAARWLADRLDRVVLAPDGPLVPAAGGALFVPAHHGLGWLRYRPNMASAPDSRRFPKPQWEYSVPYQPYQIGTGGTAEPLPGGVWIRGSWEDSATPGHRQGLIDLLAGDPDLLAVALGSPGASSALPLEAVSAFWATLPSSARHLVRFVSYGPVAVPEGAQLGQALADLLGQRVAVYAGLPSAGVTAGAREIRTLQADGSLGWRPYADEFGYTPRGPNGEPAPPPVPLNTRVPAGATPTGRPGIYQHTPEVFLEIVQSGLWVRSRNEPRDGHLIRSAPADPAHPALLYDQSDPALADHLRSAANELLPVLEPGFRDSGRVLPSSEAGKALLTGSWPPAIQLPRGKTGRASTAVAGRSESWMLEGGTGAQAPQPVPRQPAEWTDHAPATEPGAADQPAASGQAAAEQSPAAPPLPGRLDAGPAQAGLPPAPAPFTRPVAAPERSGPSAAPTEETTATGTGPAAPGTPVSPVPSTPPTPTAGPAEPVVPSAPAATPEWTEDEEPGPTPPGPPSPVRPAEPEPVVPEPPVAAPEPVVPEAPPTPPDPAAPRPRMPSIRLESSPSQPPPAPSPPAPDRDDMLPPAPQPTAPPTSEPPPAAGPTTPPVQDPGPVRDVVAPAPVPVAGAARGSVRVQPVPPAAANVLPSPKGVEKERDWVRRSLGGRYDNAAAVVARVLSQSPGLAGGPHGSSGDVLTDLAAMRLYLSGSTPDIDAAIRSASSGPHVPLARCATAGMRRLPSYRGGAILRATLNDAERAWYEEGKPVTEYSFLSALSSIRRGLSGNTDVLFWSLTARRTGLLAQEVPDRLVFMPGTRFKVLRVVDGDRPAVLLRELGAPEVDEAGNLREERVPLDEIALNGLDQLHTLWKQAESDPEVPVGDPLSDEYADAFRSAPGLLQSWPGRTVGPRLPAASNTAPRRGQNQ